MPALLTQAIQGCPEVLTAPNSSPEHSKYRIPILIVNVLNHTLEYSAWHWGLRASKACVLCAMIFSRVAVAKTKDVATELSIFVYFLWL